MKKRTVTITPKPGGYTGKVPKSEFKPKCGICALLGKPCKKHDKN